MQAMNITIELKLKKLLGFPKVGTIDGLVFFQGEGQNLPPRMLKFFSGFKVGGPGGK